jgi:DNA-binding MarR family transcriptional regulator
MVVESRRSVGMQIADLARVTRTAVDKKARTMGMTRAQWAVLLKVSHAEGMRQIDLAQEMGVEPITVARLVDRLEMMGVLERRADPVDRRAKRLFLTAAAAPLLAQVNALVDDVFATVFADVDAEELTVFSAMLGRLHSNVVASLSSESEESDDA